MTGSIPNPQGIAVDPNGNVFVADYTNNTVKEIQAVNGGIPASPTIVPLATSFTFNGPGGIALDQSGNLWVADYNKTEVDEIFAAGGYTTVITPISNIVPIDVAIGSDNSVYVSNGSETVYQYQWGQVNFGPQPVGSTSTTVQMNFTIPPGAQVGSFDFTTLGNKDLDFADAGGSTCVTGTYSTPTNCIINVKFTPQAPGQRRGAITPFDGSGKLLTFWTINGSGLGPQVAFDVAKTALTTTVSPDMTNAMRVQADAKGDLIAVIWGDAASDPNSGSLVVFKNNGSGYNAGITIAGGLSQPVDLAIDGAGNLFVLSVADGNNDPNTGSVMLFLRTATGWASTPVTVESGLNYPWGMTVDAREDLFVSVTGNGQVVEYPIAASGSGFNSPITLASGLTSPMGLALDGSQNLFIALYHDQSRDPNSGSVVALPLSASGYGAPVKVATGLSYPGGLAVDTNDNVLLASLMDPGQDLSSGVILEVPFTGAGFGTPVSLASGLTYPNGVALDSLGNVFFPDQGTNQLYELPRATAPALSFASTIQGSLSTDSAQMVSVYNIGNQPLDFSSIVFPADFPEDAADTTDCTSANPLAANGVCTLTVDFRPAAVGPLSESLILTDNALNAASPGYTTQTISLSGQSTSGLITPTITWPTPAPITYGTGLSSVQLNASTTVPGTFSYNPSAVTLLNAGTQILSATFTPADPTTYSSETVTVRLVVNQAPLTVTAANQSMTYGGAVPTLTGTLTGVMAGDGITASYSATATPSSTPGSYPITATLNDPNSRLGNYAVTNTSGTLTIAKASTGIQVASNSNPVLAENSVTLTATVTSASGTPTGVVTFLDGSTPLGTGTLNASGVATLATATLAAGSHPIAAAYAGDNNFIAATSGSLTEVVEDFNLAISGGSAGITSVTATPGSSAVFSFTLSPTGSATFPAAITLSASGLPAGATATFSPATIAAGAGSTTVTLTVQLPQTVAFVQPERSEGETRPVEARNGSASRPAYGLPFLALALLLLPYARRIRRSGKKLGQMLPLLLAAGIASAACLAGCGGSSTSTASTPVTYTIQVTGTSGALSHSMDVTLTVD